MAVKVAINGFGRIGRLAFRQMFGAKGYEVVAINDLTDPVMLANLLKYDTAQGGYCGKIGEGLHTVEAGEGSITVDGKKITIYAEKDAINLPWKELGVDVVLECTGFYTSKAKAEAHIAAGAKKVVISAPAGNDLPTIVYSVNEKTLKATDTVISAASCTTNCLAPMANTLNNLAKIKKGYMTTIHAYTGDQMTLDGPQRKGDLRRARAAAVNIVPNSTGAAKAIGLVIPELNGVLDGCAQRVPVPTGSLTQLIAIVDGKVTEAEVNAAMKAAASDSFGYTEEELVSLVRTLDNYKILGGGSNLLINNNGVFPNVIYTKDFNKEIINKGNGIYYFGSSVRLQKIINKINQDGYGGIEYLYSVPGMLGGAIYMNAGRGKQFNMQLTDYLIDVDVLVDGKVKKFTKEECKFDYRKSIFQDNNYVILGANFKFKEVDFNESKKLKKLNLTITAHGKTAGEILAVVEDVKDQMDTFSSKKCDYLITVLNDDTVYALIERASGSSECNVISKI